MKKRYWWVVALTLGLVIGSTVSAQTPGEAPALSVLDAELELPDREIDSLMTEKRITELRADIETARARLSEAQKRTRGGAEAEAEEKAPSVGVVAISAGRGGRSALLATSTGERVRVRVGDSIAGMTIQAIKAGSVVAVDRRGTTRTLGFGTPVATATGGLPVASASSFVSAPPRQPPVLVDSMPDLPLENAATQE